MKVKLITSYLSDSAGTVIDTDSSKAKQLVELKRAVYVDEPKVEVKINTEIKSAQNKEIDTKGKRKVTRRKKV